MNFSFINNIDHLYDVDLKKVGDMFVCPVCDKEYKTELSAKNHMNKKNCHTMVDMFCNTGVEQNAFDLYTEMMGEFNPQARVSLTSFRKSKSYSPTLKFVMFSMEHKIQPALYAEWIKCFYKTKYINQTLNKGTSEVSLKEFRRHLRNNEQLIESERFVEVNEKELTESDQFLVNSLYLGDIGLLYAAEHLDLENRIERMDIGLRFRLERMFDE